MTAMLNTKEAAQYLRLSTKTLEAWRLKGRGPNFVRMGSRIAYRQTDLEAWVTSHLAAPAEEPS